MRRLEFTRVIRTLPGRARNSAETAMYLAHVVRERHRLEQERQSLGRRIRRIEKQLTTIAEAETKLTPALQRGSLAADAPADAPAARPTAPTRRPLMSAFEVGDVTLQY
jgi:septal ring factor EnvC (AmiA/AmiB activator)